MVNMDIGSNPSCLSRITRKRRDAAQAKDGIPTNSDSAQNDPLTRTAMLKIDFGNGVCKGFQPRREGFRPPDDAPGPHFAAWGRTTGGPTGYPMHRFIPYLIVAAVLLAAFIAVELFRYYTARKGPRAPFSQRLERSPGQSLTARMDALNEELAIQAVSLLAVPLAIYGAYVTYLHFDDHPFDRTETAAVGAIAAVFAGGALFKMFRRLGERRGVRLAFEGQTTVGQALNRLMLNGYRVYHDVRGADFDIDHIVVGEKGVFAIETGTRSKRTAANRQQDATVAYDGRALHFPGGTDIAMIAQAKRQSKALADWLGRAIGEELNVRAVLALPGWLVKRTAAEGMPVVNPVQFDSLFEHIPSRCLTPEVVARIVQQLDRKCREADPEP